MSSIQAYSWTSEPSASVFHAARSEAAMATLPQTRATVKKTISGARFFSGSVESEKSLLDTTQYQTERARVDALRKAYEREWKSQVLDPHAELSASALTRTLRPVMGALLELGPGAIDLTNLPQGSVSGVHLAVVLRATFRRQESAPGWENALQVARFALSYQGLDEDKVLSGLLG